MRHVLVACTIAALGPALLTQAPSVSFQPLEELALTEMKRTNTPGLAMAVVSGDQVVFAKGFGVANVETGEAVTADTLFQIGSTTKMLTAAAAMSLVSRGTLDLQAPISRYVKGLSSEIGALTLSQLLSHQSGLRDQPGEYGTHGENDLLESTRALTAGDLLVRPGLVFSYSNLGFALAGLTMQERVGKPYAAVMAEELFKPLGMSRTTFAPTMAMTYAHASGHQVSAGVAAVVRPVPDDTRLWPAGYAYSSAGDLVRFARALLNNGRLDGRQALPAAIVDEMTRRHAPIPALFENGAYGFGTIMYEMRGTRVVEHAGTMPGSFALIRTVPAQRFAVIVLANEGSGIRSLPDKAMELMLTLQPPAGPPVPKPALPMTSEEIARYQGKYRNRDTIELIADGGQLILAQGQQKLPIRKIGEHRFLAAPSGTPRGREFVIGVDSAGRVEYLHTGLWAYKKVAE